MTSAPLIRGPQIQIVATDAIFTKKMDNLSSGQPLYIGEALPNSGTTEAVWRIRKLEYDNGENLPPTGEIWAGGKTDFDKQWSQRTTYSYS